MTIPALSSFAVISPDCCQLNIHMDIYLSENSTSLMCDDLTKFDYESLENMELIF